MEWLEWDKEWLEWDEEGRIRMGWERKYKYGMRKAVWIRMRLIMVKIM